MPIRWRPSAARRSTTIRRLQPTRQAHEPCEPACQRCIRTGQTILAVDAVAFSAFAGRDEMAALRALKGHVGAMEPMIGLHGGRMVKSTGDGFLAEFGSVVDAVSCADAMQKTMATRNAAQARASRLDFRMGVHVGDIVADGEDVLGDGVNIAVRLEGLAPPGGVAVSARVRDDVAGKLDLSFEDIGLRELKNIATPIQVFALGQAESAAAAPALALPDKPSVAVLAFANMAAGADDDWFAEGVADEIITALTHVPWLFVIARNSSFSFKGLNVDVRRIGSELGVRYVLDGSVRRGGGRLRVAAQLIDAENGRTIWSGRQDGSMDDLFELQDRIAADVVAAIAPEIRLAEVERARRARPESLDAFGFYLRGQDALNHARLPEAMDWMDRAIGAAPDFAVAMAMRAWLTTFNHQLGVLPSEEAKETSRALARAALEIAPTDVEVSAYAGYALGYLDAAHEEALRLIDEATARCPSFAWAWIAGALICLYLGRADEAIARAETGLRLSPRDPLAFRAYIPLGLSYLMLGAYEQMQESAATGLRLSPRSVVFMRYRMVALFRLGRLDEAAAWRARHDEMLPGFRVGPYIALIRDTLGVNQGIWRPLRETMLEMGLPE
jgi:adenylate cyclase